jgi:hypothetical protein
MTDTFKEIVERLLNLPPEEKQRLAKLASEAFARRRALDVLNDIQYEMFQRCTINYNNGRMEEFWNDVDNLDTLYAFR